jgi:hypothetical protein
MSEMFVCQLDELVSIKMLMEAVNFLFATRSTPKWISPSRLPDAFPKAFHIRWVPEVDPLEYEVTYKNQSSAFQLFLLLRLPTHRPSSGRKEIAAPSALIIHPSLVDEYFHPLLRPRNRLTLLSLSCKAFLLIFCKGKSKQVDTVAVLWILIRGVLGMIVHCDTK